MSSRAQILIEDTGIYLYDHHGGDRNAILVALHDAPKRAPATDTYEGFRLPAVILRYMWGEDKPEDGCFFGIDTCAHTNTMLLVRVNCEKEEISIIQNPNADEDSKRRFGLERIESSHSFDEFVHRGMSLFPKEDG